MKPIAPIITGTLLLSCLAAAATPALAVCGSARLFDSGYSYVITSGCEAIDCGNDGIGVTDNLIGSFWALFEGDPDLNLGSDNGAFPALGNWLYTYPGYGALISSTWGASGLIDGCIDFAANPRCMTILLTDQHPDSGDGVFALLTKAPDALLNFNFQQDGDITLSTVGRLNVVGSAIVENENSIEIALDGIDFSDFGSALYLDPACGGVADVIQGYEAFATVLPNTAMPPDSSDVDLWQVVSDVIPLGAGMTIQVDCSVEESVWLRAGLVFDSEYRTPFLSEQSTRLECHRVLAEPEPLTPRKPRGRKLPQRKPRGRSS